MTYEEKIAFLEQKLEEAKRVTFQVNIAHRIASEQELALEEALDECRCKAANQAREA